jgi:hypothetical protein
MAIDVKMNHDAWKIQVTKDPSTAIATSPMVTLLVCTVNTKPKSIASSHKKLRKHGFAATGEPVSSTSSKVEPSFIAIVKTISTRVRYVSKNKRQEKYGEAPHNVLRSMHAVWTRWDGASGETKPLLVYYTLETTRWLPLSFAHVDGRADMRFCCFCVFIALRICQGRTTRRLAQ